MKTKLQVARLLLGSTLGTLLAVGCAQPRYATTDIDRAAATSADVAITPLNQVDRRPDTNPHLRTGLWEFGFHSGSIGFPQVIDSPTLDPVVPADHTALLDKEAEANYIAALREDGQIIVEAAGATRVSDADRIITDPSGAELRVTAPDPQDVEAYRLELESRVKGTLQ